MFNMKKIGLVLAALALFTVLMVACQPETIVQTVQVEVTRVTTETVIEQGTAVIQTVVSNVQVVVTATPEPTQEIGFVDSNPDTYVNLTAGDVDTLDPALAYDTASATLLENVMEGLIYYNYTDSTTYVPALALEVPSVDNGGISADGMTYTFHIRPGVTYHNGGTLEAHDAAYSFQRGLLQSDVNGPQWLLIEPLMGYTSGDITEAIGEGAYAGDPTALKENATPEELAAVCEQVKAAIVADDEAGTLTFHLVKPWGPFLSILAQSWGDILDSEWAMENNAWDGDCATWQNYYSPGAENDELSGIVNGTGPYMLDHWTPGEEYVLTANPKYWRTAETPVWEGGPSGVPAIQTVIVRNVTEWGTRFAALQAGDAESVLVNQDNETQVDPLVGEYCDWQTFECTANEENVNGTLRKWDNLPSVARTDIFMNFNIATDDTGSNPYIGSGQLDGNGIPADFFSDIHVRRAMNYCFDYDTFIAEAQNGKGVRNNGPIILGMLGYNPDGEMYPFDMDQCKAELDQAWEGKVAEVGFRYQVLFNTGNTVRQTVGEILQANLATIDPKYQIEIVGVPWPTFLRAFRAKQLPMAISGWLEDIHDPHNWVQPFTVGTFASRQNLPDDLKAQFADLVNRGVSATDPAEREKIYFELQQLHHDQAIQVTLSQSTNYRFEQRWVKGWFYRISAVGTYYYALSLDGGSN